MDDSEKIFLEERRERIVELVNRRKRVTIGELAQAFRTGEATIRRDLSELESRGLIRRTHGGAIPSDSLTEEVAFKVRERLHTAEKKRIAQYVAGLVQTGESLMVDGGSTTLAVASELKNKSGLTVVTNSTVLAQELASGGNDIILAGGFLQSKTLVTVGPVTDRTLREFRADKVILGMSSLLPHEGFFTVSPYEAEIKRTMVRLGRQVIVAMDSSKVGRAGFSFVASCEAISTLVTDTGIAAEDAEALEKCGLEVITV